MIELFFKIRGAMPPCPTSSGPHDWKYCKLILNNRFIKFSNFYHYPSIKILIQYLIYEQWRSVYGGTGRHVPHQKFYSFTSMRHGASSHFLALFIAQCTLKCALCIDKTSLNCQTINRIIKFFHKFNIQYIKIQKSHLSCKINKLEITVAAPGFWLGEPRTVFHTWNFGVTKISVRGKGTSGKNVFIKEVWKF